MRGGVAADATADHHHIRPCRGAAVEAVVGIHGLARPLVDAEHAEPLAVGLADGLNRSGEQQHRQLRAVLALQRVPEDRRRHRPEHVATRAVDRPQRAGDDLWHLPSRHAGKGTDDTDPLQLPLLLGRFSAAHEHEIPAAPSDRGEVLEPRGHVGQPRAKHHPRLVDVDQAQVSEGL